MTFWGRSTGSRDDRGVKMRKCRTCFLEDTKELEVAGTLGLKAAVVTVEG